MDSRRIQDWGSRLDAGAIDDPTLHLARELERRRPASALPSPSFVKDLREHLLATPQRSPRTYAAWFLPIALAAALVVLAVILLRPDGIASASQVFERANQHYATLAQEEGILHTEFGLTYMVVDPVSQAPTDHYEWEGELWQSLAGPEFRYELRDRQGRIAYFAQRDEARFWRSAYPVTASRGDLVYGLTEEQYSASDDSFRVGIAPVFGNLIDWLSLDSWWLERAVDCDNPFCSLGLEDNSLWSCGERQCIFPLSSAIADVPAAEVELNLTGREARPDGRTVDVVEIRYSFGDEIVRRMQFDSDTHELVELVAYRMGFEVAKMTFGERRVVDRGHPDMFVTLPEGLREVRWPSQEPPPAPTLDEVPFPSAPRGSVPAVWASPVLAIPSKGSSLQGQTELVLFVSVPADLRQDAELIADLCRSAPSGDPPRLDPSSCTGLASASVRVPKGGGTQRLTLQIRPDDTWPRRVWVRLRLMYRDGQSTSVLDPEFSWSVEP